MDILIAVVLGIVQGVTEFLPISSTAHLTIAGALMGIIDAAHPERWTAYIAVIQLGTLVSILAYFYRDLLQITKDFFTDGIPFLKDRSLGLRHARKGWFIILGTLPVVIIGLAFKDIIEGELTKSMRVIGTSLIALALILLLAEKYGKRNKTMAEATWLDALIVGIAQAMALIPGSSRSGTTITAGLFVGLRREDAARFSFLLSVPAILASGLLQLYEMRSFIGALGVANVVIATVISGIVGYASIDFLLKYLRSHSTLLFIIYRIILGVLVLGSSFLVT